MSLTSSYCGVITFNGQSWLSYRSESESTYCNWTITNLKLKSIVSASQEEMSSNTCLSIELIRVECRMSHDTDYSTVSWSRDLGKRRLVIESTRLDTVKVYAGYFWQFIDVSNKHHWLLRHHNTFGTSISLSSPWTPKTRVNMNEERLERVNVNEERLKRVNINKERLKRWPFCICMTASSYAYGLTLTSNREYNSFTYTIVIS